LFALNMAGSSAICVAFKSTNANFIPLTMDIKANLFVEVSSHIHAMKFKLHVHLLLMEWKLHDSEYGSWCHSPMATTFWFIQGLESIKFVARAWDHPPNSQMSSHQLLPLKFQGCWLHKWN
jgi:hypothetical protein